MARILVVEPHPDVRSLVEAQLRHLGHEPVAWPGGAVDLRRFDLVLLEPAWAEALELVQHLRASHPRLRIAFLSTQSPAAETAALRPQAHLVKPVALDQLGRALERILGRPA